MLITWVEIGGVKEAIKSIQNLTKFKQSKEYRAFQSDMENTATRYWKANIYDYFDARTSFGHSNTGQLGNSLSISTVTYRMSFFMSPIYSRTDNTEYGHLLRKGFDPSPGSYIPAYDKRGKKGMHPGYDARTRWIPWINDFRSHMNLISGIRFQTHVDRFVGRTMQ